MTRDRNRHLVEHVLAKLKPTYEGLEDNRASTFLNPYTYGIVRKNPRHLDYIDDIYIDSYLLVRLLAALGHPVERKSFDMGSIAIDVLAEADKKGMKIALIGAKQCQVEAAVSIFRSRFPNIQYAYTRHGYFESEQEVVSSASFLNSASVDIVIIGMGAGRQEWLIAALRENGYRGACFTCGGFIHQTAGGRLQYYPEYINKYNLRWLYRMIREPKVIWRVLIYYPLNIIRIIFDIKRYGGLRSKF